MKVLAILLAIVAASLLVRPSAAQPGTVVAWGNADDSKSYLVSGLVNVTRVAAGGDLTMALLSNGQVMVANAGAQSRLVTYPGLTSIRAISAGASHGLGLKINGAVVAFGSNTYGQTSVPTAALSRVSRVAAGGFHSLALRSTGQLVVWGEPGVSLAGDTMLPDLLDIGTTAIAAGYSFSAAVLTDNTVVTWGALNYPGPAPEYYVDHLEGFGAASILDIAAGHSHVALLLSDGSVACRPWGYPGDNAGNRYGQLDVPPAALSGVVAIAAGYFHTLALKADGTVVAW